MNSIIERTTIDQVAEFHRVFKVFELPEPGIPPAQSQFVRFQLIMGEMSELAQGLAAQDQLQVLDALCDLQYVIDGTRLVFGLRQPHRYKSLDFTAVGGWKEENSIACLHNVLQHFERFSFFVASKHPSFKFELDRMEEAMNFAWCRLGFYDVSLLAFAEVHRSNMSKLDANGQPIVSASGKVLKGPNFFEPNLQQFLRAA